MKHIKLFEGFFDKLNGKSFNNFISEIQSDVKSLTNNNDKKLLSLLFGYGKGSEMKMEVFADIADSISSFVQSDEAIDILNKIKNFKK